MKNLILPPSASVANAEVDLAGGPYTIRNGLEIISTELPPQEFWAWFIPIGERGIVAAIVAPPGLGKSRFVLQLAASQVAGVPFCGIPLNPKPRQTLIIQSENCRTRVKRDLEFCSTFTDEQKRRLGEYLHVTSLEQDGDGDITLDERDPESGNFARLRDAVARVNPEVVVVDTWSSMCPEELDAKAIRTTLMTLRRICNTSTGPVTIVLVCHSKPGIQAAAAARGSEALSYCRGSRVLVGMVRCVLNMRACEIVSDEAVDTAPDADHGAVRRGIELVPAKCNDGMLPEPIAIALDERRHVYERVPFNHAAWQATLERMAKSNQAQTPAAKAAEAAQALTSTADRVANLLTASGPLGKTELVNRMIALGVATSKRNAGETIRWLVDNGQLQMKQPKPNRPARYLTPAQVAENLA